MEKGHIGGKGITGHREMGWKAAKWAPNCCGVSTKWFWSWQVPGIPLFIFFPHFWGVFFRILTLSERRAWSHIQAHCWGKWPRTVWAEGFLPLLRRLWLGMRAIAGIFMDLSSWPCPESVGTDPRPKMGQKLAFLSLCPLWNQQHSCLSPGILVPGAGRIGDLSSS